MTELIWWGDRINAEQVRTATYLKCTIQTNARLGQDRRGSWCLRRHVRPPPLSSAVG